MSGILSKKKLVIVGKDGKKYYMPMFITKDLFFSSGEQAAIVSMAVFCTTVSGRRLYLPLRYPDNSGLCTMIKGKKHAFIGYNRNYDTATLNISFTQSTKGSLYLDTYMRVSITGLVVGLKYEIYIKATYTDYSPAITINNPSISEKTFTKDYFSTSNFLINTDNTRLTFPLYKKIDFTFTFNISSDVKTYSIQTGDYSSLSTQQEIQISLYE